MNTLMPPFDFHNVMVAPWMEGFSATIWIVLMGFFVTTACGLVGIYLVVHLADVLLRRTDIATGAPASNTALRQCATIVASELAWSATRISDELSRTRALFPFSNKVAALQLLQGAA
jgi:hypothetical protein